MYTLEKITERLREQFKRELVDLVLDKCNREGAALQCSSSYIIKNVLIFSDYLFSKGKK